VKISIHPKRHSALTLIEVLVVLVILAFFAAAIARPLMVEKRHAQRIRCINNMKQIAIAFDIWNSGHGNTYPMFVPETNGGTVPFTTGTNLFRHFQVMSNELGTPSILICPADSDGRRSAALNFTAFNNLNVSYFAGLVSNESNPRMLLAGDHNITNGAPVKSGLMELNASQPGGWTAELHKKEGNVAFADSSVASIANNSLQTAASAGATNRLQMPILAP
jgi:prepilin-type N-terminal cleavage/methylation domain-containing protein